MPAALSPISFDGVQQNPSKRRIHVITQKDVDPNWTPEIKMKYSRHFAISSVHFVLELASSYYRDIHDHLNRTQPGRHV